MHYTLVSLQRQIFSPMSDYVMLVRMLFFLDDRFQNAHADATIVYSEVSYEKTEKNPPSNKNIPVRNLKDQIANLSSNNCAGFKSEYEVRFSIMILFPFDDFYAMVNASYRLIYRALSCCKIYH